MKAPEAAGSFRDGRKLQNSSKLRRGGSAKIRDAKEGGGWRWRSFRRRTAGRVRVAFKREVLVSNGEGEAAHSVHPHNELRESHSQLCHRRLQAMQNMSLLYISN